MTKKLTIDEALENMREWNRNHERPSPEKQFEKTLQELAVPMMKQGLVHGVEGEEGYKPEEVSFAWYATEEIEEFEDLMRPGDHIIRDLIMKQRLPK